eukprot:791006-Amphidinium_carterae.1
MGHSWQIKSCKDGTCNSRCNAFNCPDVTSECADCYRTLVGTLNCKNGKPHRAHAHEMNGP